MKTIININARNSLNKKLKGFIDNVLRKKSRKTKSNKGGKTKKQSNKKSRSTKKKNTKGGKDEQNKIIINVALSKEQEPYITVDGVHYPKMVNMWDDWFGSVEDFMGILMDSKDVKRQPKFVKSIEILYDKKKGKNHQAIIE